YGKKQRLRPRGQTIAPDESGGVFRLLRRRGADVIVSSKSSAGFKVMLGITHQWAGSRKRCPGEEGGPKMAKFLGAISAAVCCAALFAAAGCNCPTKGAPCCEPKPAPVVAKPCETPCGRPAGEVAAELPPNAKPGECYAKVWVPATYKTISERILVRDASERLEVVPAKY